MNWSLFLPLLVTAFVAIGGWLVAHRLSTKRDRDNKRRELITSYLIEAYRKLERASNREHPKTMYPVREWIRDLESSIADIQLFGTAKQVALAQQFAVEFTSHLAEGADLNDLLSDLRTELRAELGLEPVPSTWKFMRLVPKDPDDIGAT